MSVAPPFLRPEQPSRTRYTCTKCGSWSHAELFVRLHSCPSLPPEADRVVRFEPADR